MKEKAKRIILAALAPAALQVVTVAAASFVSGNQASGDQSLEFIVLLLACVTLSTIILGGDSLNGFWKIHFFSCAVSALPIALLFAGLAIFKGTQGYFWLGLTVLSVLVVVATVLSLPVTYLVYSRRSAPRIQR